MYWSRTPAEGMGFLLRICWSIEGEADREREKRSKEFSYGYAFLFLAMRFKLRRYSFLRTAVLG